ncbi:methylenetetrahydrofolate reductase C-terminal domain-containing protein [Onishia niordana]|uniref:methylenetetrahydrofolate reductase C-terminal domain-containing protein n=1 Tax=Onishia niordana TaxID=2508711 RepID=UPI001F0E6B6D|nr:methylenetetrahydrofolate reductase C-terminal domain-containing protein [Halomonas niordiana]
MEPDVKRPLLDEAIQALRGRWPPFSRDESPIRLATIGSTVVLPWQEKLVYSVRLWAARHARWFERLYRAFEPVIVKLHPLWKSVGYQRAEKPMAKVEEISKGMLFDCQMCGQCILSSTGMSCPMNCPKSMRNGPCGGVMQNGNCEVNPEMRCVWVEAWEGSQKMKEADAIHVVQLPVDHRLQGSSSWLRVARGASEQPVEQQEASQ